VERDFTASGPDELWVADFTYLRCWEGMVFFSFVIDVFSRRIVGWQLTSHMRTTLVLDALRMALSRRRHGADVQLVHHSDRGTQGGFNRCSQHLIERRCDGQACWVDDGVDGQGGDEVAGEAVVASRCGAVVLAEGRGGSEQRGRGAGRGGVLGGWQPVVPGAWWHANVHACSALGPLSVL
jgi:uncharacterized membrane protein YgcG